MSPFLLADELLLMDAEQSRPRDLPGRYGRVVADLERLLQATGTPAVVAGGWAVWRHGYAGRVTQDIDIVVPKDRLAELQRVASLCGFQPLSVQPGRWLKFLHKATGIEVDLMPEAAIPGTPNHPAPVAIRHPQVYGGSFDKLNYIDLFGLFELKLGAHRAKDIADLVELIKLNPNRHTEIREHLASIHERYVQEFDELIQTAHEES